MRYLLMLSLALAPGLAHAQYASSCQLLAPTVPVVRAPQVQHVPYVAPQKNLQPVAYAQNQYAQPVQHAQQSAPQQYAQNLAPYSNQVAQKNVNQFGPNVKNVQQQFGQLNAGYPQQKAAAYQKTQQIAGAYAPQAIYYEQQVLLPVYDHEYSFASGLASYQKGFGHPAPSMGYGHDPSNLATKDDLLAVAKSIEKLAESLAGSRPEPVPDETDSAEAQVKRGEKLLLVRCHTCHVKKPKLAQFADTAGKLLPLSDDLRAGIIKKTFNNVMPPPTDADGNKIPPLTDAEYADLKAFIDPDDRWNPSRP